MKRSLVLVLLLLVAGARPALGDAKDRRTARTLLADGAKAFRVGNFDQAIDAFKRSYDLYPDPLALYNLAQVYRQLKQNDKALFYYQQYLTEAPRAPDRAKVEQRIRELKELVAAEKPAAAEKKPEEPAPAAPPAAEQAPVVPAPAPQPVAEPSRPRPLYAWILAGAGLAATGVGVALLASAGGLDDDARQASTASQALDLRDQASSRRGLGTALAIGGAAAATVGVVLLVWNPGSDKRPAERAAIVVGPSWLGVAGRF